MVNPNESKLPISNVDICCVYCGKSMTPKVIPGGARKNYCSQECKNKAQNERRRKPCEVCGGAKESGKRRLCFACKEKERERRLDKERAERRARGITDRSTAARVASDRKNGVKVRADGKIRCAGCKEYLTPRKFSFPKSGKTPTRCRKCASKYAHDRRVVKVYGITPEAYQMIFDWQDGVCFICRFPSRKRRLAVDHDHVTGKVRGLLCRRCNRDILGYFANDRIEVFQRAIDYLTDPPLQRIVRGEENEIGSSEPINP